METINNEETVTESGSDWAELTQECLINILGTAHPGAPMDWGNAGLQVVAAGVQGALPQLRLRPRAAVLVRTVVDPGVRAAGRFHAPICRRLERRLAETDPHHALLSLSLVAQRCPNLEVLSINSCPNVIDSSMADIAFRCPMIRELDVSYCHEVSHESMALIGRNCPNLKILERNMMNWLDPSQHTGVVPDEYLNTWPQDGNSEAAAIGKSMPNLEHLELRFSKVEFCICLLLTMMGYIPGIIYALYAIIFINHDECSHEYRRRRLR